MEVMLESFYHLSDIIKNEENLRNKHSLSTYFMAGLVLENEYNYNIYLQGAHELMGKSEMCSDSIQRTEH